MTVVIVLLAVLPWALFAVAYLLLRPALADANAIVVGYERLVAAERAGYDLLEERRAQQEVAGLEPSAVVRDLFREVVVVTLKTGETFRGVLVKADPHALLLRDAMALAERDAVGIDGELIVARTDVAYIQRP